VTIIAGMSPPRPPDDRDDDGLEHEGGTGVVEETEKKLEKPKLYKVLLHNDDYTTMEFVVMVLMNIFKHQQNEAVRIMLNVHNNGIGVAGVYSYEVAETKARKTEELARQNDFPLRTSVEQA
jgi:ATP-dependent Clp protease adaptor protein ClpS